MLMPTVDYVSLDAAAVRTSIDVVSRATSADLAKPTPCRAWTLYGLLAHMATQHYGFAAASRGESDPELWKLRDLGDDPVKAYITSAEHVLTAFAEDGVTERQFPSPSSAASFPGHQAISFHFIDYVVHSWDVAKSLGTRSPSPRRSWKPPRPSPRSSPPATPALSPAPPSPRTSPGPATTPSTRSSPTSAARRAGRPA